MLIFSARVEPVVTCTAGKTMIDISFIIPAERGNDETMIKVSWLPMPVEDAKISIKEGRKGFCFFLSSIYYFAACTQTRAA